MLNITTQDKIFLQEAIRKAEESISRGGFPAGAVIVRDGKIIGSGVSIGNTLFDPTAHGEISAIRDACKNLKTSDLSNAIIYSSMEPCSMCFSAIMWSGILKIIYACSRAKVSEEYYGGHYHTLTLNGTFIHPIQLVHLSELERESLDLVHKWESK